jgi:hypothetical protein
MAKLIQVGIVLFIILNFVGRGVLALLETTGTKWQPRFHPIPDYNSLILRFTSVCRCME